MKIKFLAAIGIILFGFQFIALYLNKGELGTVQWVSGFVVVFILPGYLVSKILLKSQMGIAEKAVVSLGTSVTCVILIGFLINLVPAGLTSISWLISLSFIFIVSCIVIISTHEDSPEKYLRSFHPIKRINLKQISIFGIALVIVIAAFVIASTGAANQSYPGYTSLWMLPDEGHPNNVKVGIRNSEASVNDFILQVDVGDKVMYRSELDEMQPKEQREIMIELPAHQTIDEIITAKLSLKDNPNSVYRWVKISRSSLGIP